ncbi:hypothetical protein [Nocardia rosealba]|uniref:hypothetical protein n=1 Tax=Nocardia rosealba TaxID=2878563 RepID=UPI001CD9BA96|nr:hypothetical protein [Nocardia rosealba]MCA2209963.1 hypothetical protein [Nocardia rosealba]
MSLRALTYPLAVTCGTLVVIAAWVPFADLDQVSALAVVALGVLGYTGYQMALAFGVLPSGAATRLAEIGRGEVAAPLDETGGSGIAGHRSESGGVAPNRREAVGRPGGRGIAAGRRVRQQHRLVSRSFLEISVGERTVWQPVFYESALSTLTPTDLDITPRSISAGSTRFFPSGRARSTEPPGKLVDNPTRPADPPAFTPTRRLILDAQSTVAAPFAGLLWVYVMNGGLPAFIGATTVAAATATWLSTIRGSDPS